MWEIRRERHMELAFEHSRLLDIKRWKKLHYMDNNLYPDTMLGPWVDMQKSVPTYLAPDSKTGQFTNWKVKKADGTIVTYDGTNADAMVGYFIPRNAVARDAFSDRSYLAPIGKPRSTTTPKMASHSPRPRVGNSSFSKHKAWPGKHPVTLFYYSIDLMQGYILQNTFSLKCLRMG